MAGTGPIDVNAALQQLIDLVIVPNQTDAQANAGQLSLVQIRDRGLGLHRELSGDIGNGVLSYEQIRDYVRDNAQRLSQLLQQMEA